MGRTFARLSLIALLSISGSISAQATEVIIPALKTADNSACVVSMATCAADNYAVFNHRLNFATGDDKGFIIPSGIYPVPSLIIARNASLRGAGPGITVLKYVPVAGHAPGAVLALASTQGKITVSVSNLSVDGSGIADGISIKDTQHAHIDHVSAIDVVWGVKVREANIGLTISNVSIRNQAATSLMGGVLIGQFVNPPTVTQSNIDTFLSSIQVEGDYDPVTRPSPTCQQGIVIYSGASGVYGTKVSAVRCDTGFIVDTYPGAPNCANDAEPCKPEWIFCTDCLADTNRTTGWLFSAARGVTLDGSWNGLAGQAGVVLDNVTSTTITGLKSHNNGAEGLKITANAKEVVVANSLFNGNGKVAASGSRYGLLTEGDNVILHSNIISNVQNIITPGSFPALDCGIKAKQGRTLGASVTDNLVRHAITPVCIIP